MTTLFSLYGNPRFTMLVTATGEVVYHIKTENSVSSVLRALPKKLGFEDEEQQYTVTGKIDWNRPITFQIGNNTPVPASQFLHIPISDNKIKQFLGIAEDNDKREFTSPTGNVYQWTFSGQEAKVVLSLRDVDSLLTVFQLRLKGTREPIAIFTREHASLLVKDTRAALVLTNEGLEMLDLVVLTWIQVALLLNTFRSKGMFASTETEWALATAGGDSAKDY
ncbi:hypothetical protein CALVIDRAFT_597612 [Calocera viscosa TUFC12733]|uniref:DUF6593 domain-containing protein n=1 Tax=Calocera viscosa (strain TUFC12733) TaxID=1330018 RepID=A0A167N2A7_CALVF|nr:hypothetical protein CALVIDRAFT_597612 [Calocera viscosa TUFC12733]